MPLSATLVLGHAVSVGLERASLQRQWEVPGLEMWSCVPWKMWFPRAFLSFRFSSKVADQLWKEKQPFIANFSSSVSQNIHLKSGTFDSKRKSGLCVRGGGHSSVGSWWWGIKWGTNIFPFEKLLTCLFTVLCYDVAGVQQLISSKVLLSAWIYVFLKCQCGNVSRLTVFEPLDLCVCHVGLFWVHFGAH